MVSLVQVRAETLAPSVLVQAEARELYLEAMVLMVLELELLVQRVEKVMVMVLPKPPSVLALAGEWLVDGLVLGFTEGWALGHADGLLLGLTVGLALGMADGVLLGLAT